VAKKSVIDKLFALEDELDAAIVAETDDRIKAALGNVSRGLNHLKDSIATSENVKWPGAGPSGLPEARNQRGRPV
jgi:hypothetical protein